MKKFLRKKVVSTFTSGGDMAIIGPRPALWNQYDLIEERDKYGARETSGKYFCNRKYGN